MFQCQSCGPDGSGQCVGLSICCGESFGCYMGTPETLICEKENELSSPCRPQGENCQSVPEGQCVANSICCNSSKLTSHNFTFYHFSTVGVKRSRFDTSLH